MTAYHSIIPSNKVCCKLVETIDW